MIALVAGVLVVWRITAFLTYEVWGQPIRDLAKVYAVDESGMPITFWGRLLTCFWCTSLVVSVLVSPICLAYEWNIHWIPGVLLNIFALSGGAILINHASRVALYAER